MIPKHLILEIEDDEQSKTYQFAGTFDFARRVKESGGDIGVAYGSLTTGDNDPNIILLIISKALLTVSGESPKESEIEEVAEDFINRFGMLESGILAANLCAMICIGSKKKSEDEKGIRTRDLMDQITPGSSWKSFMKAGLFLAGMCILSGFLGCWIFSAYMMPI